MDKNIMIDAMVSYYAGGNKSLFSRMLGITPQRLSKWENRNTFDAEIIFDKLDNISPAWLLSGEGDMILSDTKEQVSPTLPASIQVEPDFERRALSRAKAKVVVEIDLDDDEFVKLGLSSKVVQILKQK